MNAAFDHEDSLKMEVSPPPSPPPNYFWIDKALEEIRLREVTRFFD
jgi:hypothetical protein